MVTARMPSTTPSDSDRDLVEVHDHHLGADEDQDQRQAVVEQVELAGRRLQHEVHRAQARIANIAGQHDERVAGDGEDGRDGVDREDHVGEADQRDHHQQRGGDAPAVLHRPEFSRRRSLGSPA